MTDNPPIDDLGQKSRPRTRIQKRNVGRILDAALEVFADRGFAGATLDQIAERAGMSKPNLLYYYASKRDLYLATLQRILDLWLEPLEAFSESDDPRNAIRAYVTRKLQVSRSQPIASRVFANEIIQGAPVLRPVLEGPLKALVDEKARIIRGWIRRGAIAEVDPYHFIFAIWAVTQHYADFSAQIDAILGKDLSDEGFYRKTEEAVTAHFLRVLAPGPEAGG